MKLRAFKRIAESVGESKLYAIGLRIPENAKFPPHIKTIDDAVASIDVAYHMNHRKAGKVMFDPATGAMLEGIGHYGYKKLGPRSIESVSANPYPCSFDRGIITTMARRFEKGAAIVHDDTFALPDARSQNDSAPTRSPGRQVRTPYGAGVRLSMSSASVSRM